MESESPQALEIEDRWLFESEAATFDASPTVDENEAVFAFCPMCGELAPESKRSCPACGEPLPMYPPRKAWEADPHSLPERRFRRRARLLGLLWIVLAYALAEQDFWVGGQEITMPEMLLAGQLTLPPIPLLTTVLAALAAFALAGQFWAVAVGGLLNYLILFIVVWKAHPASVSLLAVSIVLTHAVLQHPPTRGVH